MERINLAFLALSLCCALSVRADVQATSCNQPDVQAAINSAVDLDRVFVPAGQCTWTSGISITQKRISLVGAGRTQTLITIRVSGAIFLGTGSRITGFGFTMDPAFVNLINAKGQDFRVDNNRFESTAGIFAVFVSAPGSSSTHPTGVIDRNEFINMRVVVFGTLEVPCSDSNDCGRGAWGQTSTIGNPDQTGVVYVEDNVFSFSPITSNINADAIDSNAAGRFVFRRNMVRNTFGATHSVQGNQRASKSWEIYDNTFEIELPFQQALFLRGGTGVAFNNTFLGLYSLGILLDNRRSNGAFPLPAGGCDGSSTWDGNQTNGYPCRDQIGRGSDITLWTDGSFPYDPLPSVQASEPAYFWGNTLRGSPVNPVVSPCLGTLKVGGTCADIVLGRDYFIQPRPGYNPFIYPHPLTKRSWFRPDPPSNVRTSP